MDKLKPWYLFLAGMLIVLGTEHLQAKEYGWMILDYGIALADIFWWRYL